MQVNIVKETNKEKIMRTGIIKDPTFTKYSNGGNVERKGKETIRKI